MQTDFKILHRVDSPADLRRMSMSELKLVCEELRRYIIEVVENKGGHLSSPLGVVDLTVALHRVFETPNDLLIWDVGHQTYAHKIITGRRDEFPTLRKYGGISGFPRSCESEYDVFDAGHASTSISVALGMAKARDIKGEKHRVVAIIGDGALTGGLSFEGLNNASNLKNQLLIVLNDNQMSISPTVGAISRYLTRVVTNPLYNRVRDEIWKLTGRLPRGSRTIRRFLHTLQEGLKSFIVPGMIFEELGIRYFGPIEGHNLEEMIETFENLKDFHYPAVVHVLTRKGIGKPEIEADPLKYYSIPDKSPGGGKKKETAPAYSEVFGKVACELAEKNDSIYAVVAAMREGTGLVEFAKKYPDRFYDSGIAEGHAVTFSGGLAASGLRPIVAIYSTFLQRAYDMVFHDVALQKLPVIFALDRAGIVGPDGPTHNGVFDISLLQTIPGLTISAPKDGNELRNLLFTALERCRGPFVVRYPKATSIRFDGNGDSNLIEIGSWELLREGDNLAILAVGSMVEAALRAVDELDPAIAGQKPAVINARFIKPMDEEILQFILKNFKAVLTIEEGTLYGGFGSSVLSRLNERGFSGCVHSLGIPDKFIEHGSRDTLLDQLGLTSPHIGEKVKEILVELG